MERTRTYMVMRKKKMTMQLLMGARYMKVMMKRTIMELPITIRIITIIEQHPTMKKEKIL
jgi:hypothetical protein